MAERGRNPLSPLESKKQGEDAWAERERRWIKDFGISTYDPPSSTHVDPVILSIDDPYWKDTKREIMDSYYDASNKDDGIYSVFENTIWRVSTEKQSEFKTDLAIEYLRELQSAISLQDEVVNYQWLEARYRDVERIADHAYQSGAYYSSAAMAALAECLKFYRLKVLQER